MSAQRIVMTRLGYLGYVSLAFCAGFLLASLVLK